ncbi:hypothetical protein ACTXQV_60600, partial [Klebsiella pneumoniae]
FFTFLTMNNAHMLFLLFPSSGLLAGVTINHTQCDLLGICTDFLILRRKLVKPFCKYPVLRCH